MTAEWVPAFEGQRPPFQPGNDVGRQFEPGNAAALQSGAWSPRRVDPLAAELVAVVLADESCMHAHGSAFRPALWAWARAEAQVQLLSEYLERRGQESGDGVGDLDEGRVQTAYRELHRAEARATTQRTRLGLDPLSAAKLGRDRAAGAADTARLMAELHRQQQDGNR